LAITKERKQALVAEYRDRLERSKAVVLASFSGLSVKDMEEIRRKLREQGGELHVVKNRLVRLAFREAGLPVPEEALTGTTVMGYAPDDAPGLAKTIVDAAKASEFIRVKGGVIDGVLYGARQVEMLADLPPLPVLRELIGSSKPAGAWPGARRHRAQAGRCGQGCAETPQLLDSAAPGLARRNDFEGENYHG
jgi:large subunit ribosomal protein L10